MTRITDPLFGTAATGAIAGLGYFRRGKHGPEFIPAPDPAAQKARTPKKINEGFRIAHAQWLASPTGRFKVNGKWITRHVTPWPIWWNNWLNTHPEYRD